MNRSRASQINIILIFLVSFFFLYLSREILFPFIMGVIFAYLLDPILDKMPFSHSKRSLLAGLLVAGLFMILAYCLILIVPQIYSQILALISKIPEYKKLLEVKLLPLISTKLALKDQKILKYVGNFFVNFYDTFFNIVVKFLKNLLSSTFALLNLSMLLIITPIITFYCLNDYEKIQEFAKNILPKKYKKNVIQNFKDLEHSLSGFFRGQIIVCFFVGLYYVFALNLVNLNFANLVGLISGLICFIPYAGFAISFIIALIIGFLQFADYMQIFYIIGIFFVGHIFESYILVPKIIGNKIGIHPVWLIFATFFGGAVFGFFGMLVAIPIMICLKLIAKIILRRYYETNFYKN